jgi:CARDB
MKIFYILILSIAFITILGSAITSVFAVSEPVKAIDNQSKVMYSVKFVCVPLVGPDKEGVFVPQNYSTVINVHNPYSHSISFLKKAVVAQSEDEQRGQISKFMKDELKPDQALSINCKDIVSLFNNTSSSIGDGFVVLLSDEKLDVSSVYTTQNSIDVEYIQPTIPSTSDKLPDLTIKILTLQGNCPTGQGSCIHPVEMKVTNLSTEAVNTPFNIKTNSDNGLSTIQTISSISGSTSQTVTAVLGPGNNCWNPDCQIDTFVDSSNIVIESDETNNKDSYFSLG